MNRLLLSPTFLTLFLLLIACGSETQNKPLSESVQPTPEIEPESFPQYTLPNTTVRTLKSTNTGIEYVLYVSLPQNYTSETKKYPVLYLLDADYSFAIAHNVVEHFTQRNNLDETIIVWIAYPGKSRDMYTYRRHRVRDYTATHVTSGVYSDEISAYSGGGLKFAAFIRDELIPFIGDEFRVTEERGITGHSLGGYYATYLLIHSLEIFTRYIIVSPSLWCDDHLIFGSEYSRLTAREDTDIRVFFGIGEHENHGSLGWLMVDDMRRMSRQLRDLNIEGMRIESVVFDNKNHNSVFPAAFTRGVRSVFD